jgi:MFS family permease
MGTGPLLAGILISYLNYRGMYAAVAVILLVCLFLYHFLHGRTLNSKIREASLDTPS